MSASSPRATFAVLPPLVRRRSSGGGNDDPKNGEQQQQQQNGASVTAALSDAATSASRTIGSLFPSSLTNLATRRYTLPDRTTASQVLMYRQLLHTSCKPGLRLSRKFEGTPAQKTVMHMPWWDGSMETSGKMVISYDNLITRLWMAGAVLPFAPGGIAQSGDGAEGAPPNDHPDKVESLLDDKGLPPVPHPYWVERLGFQQEDPVTDFRSGGVLSLAMLLHVAEDCPRVHRRFLGEGDAAVLPYAITSINVTDMLAKLLMFSKSVEKVDALLSSKPFWRMFTDPDALLVLQEISMDALCDTVCELRREYREEHRKSGTSGEPRNVTVFDFHAVMHRTERRVRNDILGAGPKTVQDLRNVAERVRSRNMRDAERKEEATRRKLERQASSSMSDHGVAGGSIVRSLTGGLFGKGRSGQGNDAFGEGVVNDGRNYDLPSRESPTPEPSTPDFALPQSSDPRTSPSATSTPDLLG